MAEVILRKARRLRNMITPSTWGPRVREVEEWKVGGLDDSGRIS